MKKLFIFSLFFLFFAGLISFPLPSFALTVSPAKFVISADPGDKIVTGMKIRNDLTETLTFYPTIEKYTTRGGEEPVFYPENFGLPVWIKTDPAQVTLAGGEWAEISLTIEVPKDAEPGGHYAVIFWSSANPEGQGPGVGIVTRVGALVLLEVSGNVIESAEITAFNPAGKFLTHLPVNFSYDFKNTGNVHLKPAGGITIKNIFGKTLANLNVNPAQGYALPQTIRTFSYSFWAPKRGVQKIQEIKETGFLAELKKEMAGFALGFYRADLNLEYGNGDVIKTVKAKTYFFVIPWHLLIVAVLALGILLLIIIKGIKKYNQWIIKRAQISSRI